MPTDGIPAWLQYLGWLVAAALGSGGVAAWIRARGQNRVDVTTVLTAEQTSFRKDLREQANDLRAQIATLTQRNEYVIGRLDAVATRNSELVQINAKLEAKVEMLEARDEAKELKIDDLSNQLTILFEERRRQATQIRQLETENMSQQNQIEQLRAENLDCHKMITEQSQLLIHLQVRDPAMRTRAMDVDTEE